MQVEKIRFNKAYDFAFKMVVAAPSMLAPKFAHWIHGVANVLETILLHYDALGFIDESIENKWSEYYLDTNFFTPDGFTQRWGQARFDLTTEHQRSLFQLHDPALNELVYLRASSFEWLNKATKIQPIREDRVGLVSTMLTGELNGAAPQRLVVDYDAFSMYRNKILNKGIKAQSQLSVIIARTSYLSTLTKSIRGDGKVGGQHLSGALDLIERQVMHDTDTLNDIQSLQQESVRLHNSHIDALEKIEKSVIEGVAMAGYFGLYFFKPALLQGVLGLMSIVLVKTLANMVHGALIAYRTMIH